MTVRAAYNNFVEPPEGALRWVSGIAGTGRRSSNSPGSGSVGSGSGGWRPSLVTSSPTSTAEVASSSRGSNGGGVTASPRP